MKRKLRLLLMAILLSVSYLQAQVKTDVWDFGSLGEPTVTTTPYDDTNLYTKQLTVAIMNAWFPGVTPGTLGKTMPKAFTVGALSWVGNASDKLRTSNTSLTRTDDSADTSVSGFTGRINCNGTTTGSDRYFNLDLKEDDEVVVYCKTDIATGTLIVSNTRTNLTLPAFSVSNSKNPITEVKFVAKDAGIFKIYSSNGSKGDYYRITRKPATYITVTGTIDESQASGITGYSVVFTNAAGKSWTAPVTSSSYSVNLPSGYIYQVSLANANRYVVSSGGSLNVTDTTTSHNLAVQTVPLFTVSGTITGLGTDISKVNLLYTPIASANKIYIPQPVINATTSTYTVDLEPNTQYTVSATGVNDYEILANTITIPAANTTTDIAFTPKPVYPITITATGLNATQEGKLKLVFTNMNESGYVYNFNYGSPISLRDGTYAVTFTGLTGEPVELKLISNLTVNRGAASKTLAFKATEDTSTIPYAAEITVGTDKQYQTINGALKAVARMTARTTERVTIKIDPGNYEEMIVINKPNITLKNAASSPSIALKNAGVDIDDNAVRITSYYGLGYNYFSQGSDNKWNADALAVNKENGYTNYVNVSGTTNASYWNATVVVNVGGNGFIAENIIIENSYNQYISKKESEDVVVLTTENKGVRPTTVGSTAVQAKSFVERAAAIGIANNIDKVILNNCRVVGRQDSFFGGLGARVVVYKGVMMGATDYIFGGMTAVFYKTDLAMNTSADPNDVCYITAAQQTITAPQTTAPRGYLMYECKITSAVPGTETASTTGSKPGYFGRPWAPNTSEVVFYNTTIENSTFPTNLGQSLILPLGWNDSLNGITRSPYMYEYGSVDTSNVPVDTSSRAAWATKLSVPTLTDTTPITTFNFTKGSDGWDPLPQLISNESLGTKKYQPTIDVTVYTKNNKVLFSGIKSKTNVAIYSLTGALVKSAVVNEDSGLTIDNGIYIVKLKSTEGEKTTKVIVQ